MRGEAHPYETEQCGSAVINENIGAFGQSMTQGFLESNLVLWNRGNQCCRRGTCFILCQQASSYEFPCKLFRGVLDDSNIRRLATWQAVGARPVQDDCFERHSGRM